MNHLDKLENKSIHFITHNVDEAVYLANRVVIMSSAPGRIKRVMDIYMNRPRKRLSSEYVSTVEG